MAGKFIDFDRQFAQMQHDTITIQLFGKQYTVPAIIPAVVPLELARYDDQKAVPTKVILRAARLIFGDALDEWATHPEFSSDMLGDVIKGVFKMINGDADGDAEEITEDDAGDAGENAGKK